MLAIISSVWPLLFGVSLIMVGNGLQGTLLGVRAALENFPTAATGLIMSGYYVGFLAGSTLAPKVVRRVGHVRVFAALAALASATVLLHDVFPDPWVWGGVRILTGFCYAALFVVSESWLNNASSNEIRGGVFSIYMVIQLGSMGAGQFLLALADPAGSRLFILVSVLLSVAIAPVSLIATRTPKFAEPERLELRRLFSICPLGILGTFGVGVAHGSFWGMGAVYAQESGLSLGQISMFMGVSILGGVVFQWPVGRFSDKFDRREVIRGTAFLAAGLALLAVPVSLQAKALLPALGFLLLGASLPLYSLFVAYTNDRLTPEQTVAASSALVLSVGTGAIIGPTAIALVMSAMGPHGFFAGIALFHAAIGALTAYHIRREKSGSRAAQAVPSALPGNGEGKQTADVGQDNG
jgi:MFS family permease